MFNDLILTVTVFRNNRKNVNINNEGNNNDWQRSMRMTE